MASRVLRLLQLSGDSPRDGSRTASRTQSGSEPRLITTSGRLKRVRSFRRAETAVSELRVRPYTR